MIVDYRKVNRNDAYEALKEGKTVQVAGGHHQPATYLPMLWDALSGPIFKNRASNNWEVDSGKFPYRIAEERRARRWDYGDGAVYEEVATFEEADKSNESGSLRLGNIIGIVKTFEKDREAVAWVKRVTTMQSLWNLINTADPLPMVPMLGIDTLTNKPMVMMFDDKRNSWFNPANWNVVFPTHWAPIVWPTEKAQP